MKPSAAPRAGPTIQQQNVFALPIHDWNDVRRVLHQWMGVALQDGSSKQAAASTAANIATAVRWYEQHLAEEFPAQQTYLKRAFVELLGIDFHWPVRACILAPQQRYQTYVASTIPRWVPAADRADVLREQQRRNDDPQLGGFLTMVGTPSHRLGIHAMARQCVRVVALQPIAALQSRASGIVDNWSDKPYAEVSGVWHQASGGGEQYRISKRLARDRTWLAILAPRAPNAGRP